MVFVAHMYTVTDDQPLEIPAVERPMLTTTTSIEGALVESICSTSTMHVF